MEKLINETDQRLEQQLKMSEEVFEVACTAQKRFAEGGPSIKKEILAAVQSNLTLKDKKLLFEAKKPFLILENTIYPEKLLVSPIEPEKTVVTQRQNVPSIFMRPYLLGGLDDVRTSLEKARHAATLIYAHFRKEFVVPDTQANGMPRRRLDFWNRCTP